MSADIRLGSGRGIGSTDVDEKLIRAEGGPGEARLIVPVEFSLHPHTVDRMLVVTDLTASLYLGDGTNPTQQVGLPATPDLSRGYWIRSGVGTAPNVQTIQAPIPLNPAAVQRLEAARHAAPDDLVLTLKLNGRVAWVRNMLGPGIPGEPVEEDPFQGQYGTHSLFSYFWTVDFSPLRVLVNQSAWIKNVLPGLGIDNLRLIEIDFPPDLSGIKSAAKAYDSAVDAYHYRKYADCIEKCRVIVNAWNRHTGATKQRPMGKMIGDKRGWSETDPRRAYLSVVWKALLDFLDAAHHQENPMHAFEGTSADAQFVLRQVAILSGYMK